MKQAAQHSAAASRDTYMVAYHPRNIADFMASL